jgi:hypothetical protein|tara:strand:- start:455 stop:823 length:369 start_codon:yes stop_codon:yes gene_type:complete
MASTRLNNSKGWYCHQQSAKQKTYRHEMWKYKCISKNSAFPGVGVNMPMMTNGYNNGILSENASDIESCLFGIGSTNLVKQKAPIEVVINKMPTATFFTRPDIIMPNPLVIEKCQRAKGPFC